MIYKVLIADDNVRSLTVLRKLLEPFTNEFEVRTLAYSGIEFPAGHQIHDIIILNFDDPLKDGYLHLKL
jgi:CheY-like chemotaxis protein